MEKCKADFQLFERKDVKIREDLKHEKKALKTAQDALKRESSKKEELVESTKELGSSVPKLRSSTEKVAKQLAEKEAQLETLLESFKGQLLIRSDFILLFPVSSFHLEYSPDEVSILREKLLSKQQELEPWKAKLTEQSSVISMLTAELDMISGKQSDAEAAFEKAKMRVVELKKQRQEKVRQRNAPPIYIIH